RVRQDGDLAQTLRGRADAGGRQPQTVDLGRREPVLLGGGHVLGVRGQQRVGAGLQGGGTGEQPGVFACGRHGRQLARGGAGTASEGGAVGREVGRGCIHSCVHGVGKPPRIGSRPGSGATGTSRNGAAGGGSWASEKFGGNCTRTGSSA